jgi:surface protein
MKYIYIYYIMDTQPLHDDNNNRIKIHGGISYGYNSNVSYNSILLLNCQLFRKNGVIDYYGSILGSVSEENLKTFTDTVKDDVFIIIWDSEVSKSNSSIGYLFNILLGCFNDTATQNINRLSICTLYGDYAKFFSPYKLFDKFDLPPLDYIKMILLLFPKIKTIDMLSTTLLSMPNNIQSSSNYNNVNVTIKFKIWMNNFYKNLDAHKYEEIEIWDHTGKINNNLHYDWSLYDTIKKVYELPNNNAKLQVLTNNNKLRTLQQRSFEFDGDSHLEWQSDDDVDIKDIYDNKYGRVILYNDGKVESDAYNYSNVTIYSTDTAFAILKSDGTVVTMGNDDGGGDSSSVQSELQNVQSICSNRGAFAALKSDGTVVTWGYYTQGGDYQQIVYRSGHPQTRVNVQSQLINVQSIYSTNNCFAALKSDGSVVVWGTLGTVEHWDNSSYNIYYNQNNVPDIDPVGQFIGSGIEKIYAKNEVFVALNSYGTAFAWGKKIVGGDLGGIYENNDNDSKIADVSSYLTSGVESVYFNEYAVAALKSNGSVVTWGNSGYGGDSDSVSSYLTIITEIYSTDRAFAALKAVGYVVTWGDSGYGGDSSSVSSNLTSEVTKIYSTDRAFAALKSDGSVVTWGDSDYGGDSASVSNNLTSGVTKIYSTERAFAALKSDGSVVTWGDSGYGGDSASVSHKLTSGVQTISSNNKAFAAVKDDGSVITWGHTDYGGDSASIRDHLTSGVQKIYALQKSPTGNTVDRGAFIVSKNNNSIITWGTYIKTIYGLNITANDNVNFNIELTNVKDIYFTDHAYAALKDDGSIHTWGDEENHHFLKNKSYYTNWINYGGEYVSWDASGNVKTYYGGDSSSVQSNLHNVKSVYSTEEAFAALKTKNNNEDFIVADYETKNDASYDNVYKIYKNLNAYAVLHLDGEVTCFGNSDQGGDSSSVQSKLVDVYEICPGFWNNGISIYGAFAALKNDGSVITWGYNDLSNINDVSHNLTSDVKSIYSNNEGGFAALKSDGSVVTWGITTVHPDVESKLTSGVTMIYSNQRSFAALKSNGSVVTWGFSGDGGYDNNNNNWGNVKSFVEVSNYLSNIIEIIPLKKSSNIAHKGSYVALKNNGTIISWGHHSYGGVTGNEVPLTGITQVYSTMNAYVVVTDTNNAFSWGNPNYGAFSSDIEGSNNNGISNVHSVYSTNYAFAFLKDVTNGSGSVVTTGDQNHGGNGGVITNVKSIYSTNTAFTALKSDGKIISWGNANEGGDSSYVNNKINNDGNLEKIEEIYSTNYSFLAVVKMSDPNRKTIIIWGYDQSLWNDQANPIGVYEINMPYSIVSSDEQFVIYKQSSPSVVVWGGLQPHGSNPISIFSSYTNTGTEITFHNTAPVDSSKLFNIKKIYTTKKGFTALTKHGSVITWGRADQNESGAYSLNAHSLNASSFNINNKLMNITNIKNNSNTFIALSGGQDDNSYDNSYDYRVYYNSNIPYRDADNIPYNDQLIQFKKIYVNSSEVNKAFAAVTDDGNIVTWGDSDYGGGNLINHNGDVIYPNNVQSIASTQGAFAALNKYGSVFTWGHSDYGGHQIDVIGTPISLYNVQSISATDYAFAALKEDGTVVTWGNSNYGGVSGKDLTDTQSISATARAFAALKEDGTVVTWGDIHYGGYSTSVTLTSVQSISATERAFAALKTNGSVVTWGDSAYGGDSSNKTLTSVQSISATERAFAALKTDSTVITWGDIHYGGNGDISHNLTSVETISATEGAFAALKTDGSVVTWGKSEYGGDSSGNNLTNSTTLNLTNIQSIYSTKSSFAALKDNDNITIWGYNTVKTFSYFLHDNDVISIDDTSDYFSIKYNNYVIVATWGQTLTNPASYTSNINDYRNIKNIIFNKTEISDHSAFAVLKTDGSVVTWGNSESGGDSSSVNNDLTSNIQTIYSTNRAFAALKSDGSVITWGHAWYGAYSSDINWMLTNVRTIYSTDKNFAALKETGTYVMWGDPRTLQSQSIRNLKAIYPYKSGFITTRDVTVQFPDIEVGAAKGQLGNQLGYSDWKLYYTSGATVNNIITFDDVGKDISDNYFKQNLSGDDLYPYLLAPVYSERNNLFYSMRHCLVNNIADPFLYDVSQITNMRSLCSVAHPDYDSEGEAWYSNEVESQWTTTSNWKTINISNWNVSNVTNMELMFSNARAFNSDLSKWDVSKVTNMELMFYRCLHFNSPLYKWNTSKVTSMYRMFYRCFIFNQDIRFWNVSKVTDMKQMFYNCSQFNQDLHRWDVSKVTDMERMFAYCSQLTTDLRYWNVTISNYSRVKKMIVKCDAMQNNYSTMSQTMFNTSHNGRLILHMLGSKHTNTYEYTQITNDNIETAIKEWYNDRNQAGAKYGGHISEWDLSQFTDLRGCFDSKLSAIVPRDTKDETHISSNYTIEYWDISGVTNISCEGCTNMDGKLYWDTSNIENMEAMFKNCTKLNTGIFTTHENTDPPLKPDYDMNSYDKIEEYVKWIPMYSTRECWNINNVTSMKSFLEGCTAFNEDINLTGINTGSEVNFEKFLSGCSSFSKNIDFSYDSNVNLSDITIAKKQKINSSSMKEMFKDCQSLAKDFRYWKLYNVSTDFTDMFKDAKNLINEISTVDSDYDPETTYSIEYPDTPTYKFFNLNKRIAVDPSDNILIGPGLDNGYIYSNILKTSTIGQYDANGNSFNTININNSTTIDLSSNAIYLLNISQNVAVLELYGNDNSGNAIQTINPGFNAIVSPILGSGEIKSYTDISGNLTNGSGITINNIQIINSLKNDMYYKVSKNTSTASYPIKSGHGYIVYTTATEQDSSWNIITTQSV